MDLDNLQRSHCDATGTSMVSRTVGRLGQLSPNHLLSGWWSMISLTCLSRTIGYIPSYPQKVVKIVSIGYPNWLVVSNMFFFHNVWDNPSQWLSYFQDGCCTTNQLIMRIWWYTEDIFHHWLPLFHHCPPYSIHTPYSIGYHYTIIYNHWLP